MPDICYDAFSITLHWLTFFLVVIVGTLGLLRDSWPTRQSQVFWIDIHALLGILLWLLVIARVAWRSASASRTVRSQVPRADEAVAELVHRILYVLLLATPLLGIVAFVYHGRVFDLGLFRIDPGIALRKTIYLPAQQIHGYLAYCIFGLAVIHAVAAIWHQLVLRDGVLGRMWPAMARRRIR